ncbi:MAG: DUF2318 domain-containing protein [Clostridia bacterium]|nr:DUF2318 domain-containing protein [Clostridia bacterium]
MKRIIRSKKIIVIIGLMVVMAMVFSGCSGQEEKTTAADGADLVIPKGEITETAKFYPYKSGETDMEILAVKASDGSIRTAFNTCQVCQGSGKAYYKQEGNELVCQNCGNRFKMDMVEMERGGCNPVPILKENKKDDGTNIVISKDFIAQNKGMFENWKSQ